ncbi:hypothetical protein MA9V2_072 [Chryseobacterium phage MA9V-2]|nr:hypothetical protein MA9V2_072 [Chryseobacterium phage MA9V-2]
MKKQFIITFTSTRYVSLWGAVESARRSLLLIPLNDTLYDNREDTEAEIALDMENFPDRQYSIVEILTKL